MKQKANNPETLPPLCFISDSESYPLREFCRRLRLGEDAMASLRRKGLKIDRVGKQAFVRGREWHRYLDSLNPIETIDQP